MDLLQALLAPLVLLLQLVQLHPQVLPLLTELVLQLLERRLRLRQLHLQALLQQRDLRADRRKRKRCDTHLQCGSRTLWLRANACITPLVTYKE